MKHFLNLTPLIQKKRLNRERMFLLMHGIIGTLVVLIAFNAIMLTIARFILIGHFKTLRDDVWAMWRQGHIKKRWLARFLHRFVRLAQRYYPKKVHISRYFLRQFEKWLNHLHPRYIDQTAHDFLIEELDLLKQSL